MEEPNIEKVKVLGQGTYGKCYLALDKSNNQLCVLKQIEIMGMTQAQIDESVKEAKILQSLNHPYIIKFLRYYQTKDGHLNILMSYADGGDLGQKIKEYKVKAIPMTESTILQIFTQVCMAVLHVHQKKIIHRDIKSQNVFLTKQGDVKLGDFGIARPLQLTMQQIKSVVGTPYYMSPEIYDNKEYSFKTDIWSLGVLLLQMCLLKSPFDANSLPALALKISKGQYTPVPKQYSKEMKKLVSQMMQVDPDKRPNIKKVLDSPLLRDQLVCMRPKELYDSDSSSGSSLLQEPSLGHKKRSGPSKALYIDCQTQEITPLEYVSSPKSQQGIPKHHDMPVRRTDNYMKEPLVKKSQKKVEQLRRREVSQPNLTPKSHTKIEHERKVMVKNNSQLNFEKKKSGQAPCFKKKTKSKEDAIVRSLQQINECKNDIYSMQGQISHRDKEVSPPMDIAQLQEESSDNGSIECPEETLMETLDEVLKQLQCNDEISKMYDQCGKTGGICQGGTSSGLVTLAWGLRNL